MSVLVSVFTSTLFILHEMGSISASETYNVARFFKHGRFH